MPKGIRKKTIAKPQTYEEWLIDGATESAVSYRENMKNLEANKNDISRIEQQIKKLQAEVQSKKQANNQLEEIARKSCGSANTWGQIICSVKRMSFEEMETLFGLALALSKPIENPIIHDYLSELQKNGHKQLLLEKYAKAISELRDGSEKERKVNSEVSNDTANATSVDVSDDGT